MALNDRQEKFCIEYLNCKNLIRAKVLSGLKLSISPGSKYFVYALVDSSNEEIFYIGKGCKNRPYHHLMEAKKNCAIGLNPFKYKRINEILAAGNEVDIYYLAVDLDEEIALRIEGAFINTIGTKNLTNIQHGVAKATVKELAKISLSKILPYDVWLRQNPDESQLAKEIYWKVKDEYRKIIAENGYVSEIIVKNGVVTEKWKR